MDRLCKNFQQFLLLLIYCSVAFAGSFVAIQALPFFEQNSATITCVHHNEIPAKRLSWVPNRHIPAFPKIETKPSTASIQVATPEPTPWQYLQYSEPDLASCSFKYYRFLPRDPPSA